MKESLIQYLVCPDCRGTLDLAIQTREEKEIVRGTLRCRCCTQVYPITKGVPRFVGTDSYSKSFSFQWKVHRTIQVDSLAGHDQSFKTFVKKTGFTESELKEKLVLDVGCGTGRYMEVAVKLGAEVIGVDLSYAVDAAYRNMGWRQGLHVVQADVFRLPFGPHAFDAIYSIGVLHHTPSTREAFLCLPPLLKPRGLIAIWVYAWAGEWSVFLDRLRALTVRVPSPMLYGLCWVCVPMLHAMACLPLLWRIAWRIPTSDGHRGLIWDVLDTFDLWSPRYQWKHTEPEVREWFEKGGLTDVSALSFPVSMRGRRPLPDTGAVCEM